MTNRMGVKRGDDDWASFMRPARHGAARHGLMAKVESVEIAERDDRAAQIVRDRVGMD